MGVPSWDPIMGQEQEQGQGRSSHLLSLLEVVAKTVPLSKPSRPHPARILLLQSGVSLVLWVHGQSTTV